MTDTKRLQENRQIVPIVPEDRAELALLTPPIRLTILSNGFNWHIGHFYFPYETHTRQQAYDEFRRLMQIERQIFFVDFRNNRNDQAEESELKELKGIENTY